MIVAEQHYMGSCVTVLADRLSYAIALARLLYESGALTTPVRDRDPDAAARRLTTTRL